MERKDVLIIHGGGLVDPSKEVIRYTARRLLESQIYGTIYVGMYSFMSLYDPKLWMPYDQELDKKLENVRGTYLGTCRGIDMTEPRRLDFSINVLKSAGIGTVIVCGGDGSSRNCAEIASTFEREGINIIFAVPLTVDGINGGYAIGLDQAAREAERQIENVVATSLETRDNGQFSVVAVELQGRNRDDILAKVLQDFWRKGKIADCDLKEINLKVVPANYETNEAKLMEEINSSTERTLLLVSEGAKLKVNKLQDMVTNRKVRTQVVGHAVQSNGMTTPEDMERYADWLDDVVRLISMYPEDSYCIVNDGISRWREPIDYYARLNPRDGQKAEISKGLEELLKKYMA